MTMMTTYPTPDSADDLLTAYAMGRLGSGLNLLAATHVALRPSAQTAVREVEMLSGVMMERAAAAPMRDTALTQALEAIDDLDDAPPPLAPAPSSPLSAAIDGRLDALSWRTRMPGMMEVRLGEAEDGAVKLVRFRAGRLTPKHTHAGAETTLVLQGSYTDGTGRYDVGDIQFANGDMEHQPHAGDECDCVCLTVLAGGVHVRQPVREFVRYFLQ